MCSNEDYQAIIDGALHHLADHANL
jgi:hypothetical protein